LYSDKFYYAPLLLIVIFLFLNVKAESTDSAFAAYSLLQKTVPAESRLKQAKSLFKEKKYSEASKLAFEITTESIDARVLVDANFLLGEIYEKNKNLKLAEKYYWKTLQMLDGNVGVDVNSEFDVFFVKQKAKTLIKLSKVYNLYDDQVKIDSSSYFLNKLIAIDFKDNEIEFLKGQAYNNLFVKEFNQNNYHKSKDYVFKAIEVFKKTNHNFDLSVSYQNLASLFEALKNSEQAFETYMKALGLVEDKNDLKSIEYKEELYFNMAWTLYNLKDYKAYDYLYKSYVLKDSLVNVNLRKELKKIEQVHNIDLIKKEEETKREQLEKRTWILVAIGGLILISGLFFFRISRLRQRNLELEISQKEADQQKKIDKIQIESQEKILNAAIDAKEKERKLIAETLHDNVSAMLSSANLHLTASKQHFDEIPEEIEKTQQIIKETSVKVRDLSHNLVSSTLLKFGLEFAIKEAVKKYSNSTIKFVSIASNIERYNQEFEIKVFNIIQEFMNNILKHSKATIAYIVLDGEDNNLQVIVKDDGVGIPKESLEANSGIGLSQIRARVRQMQGEIHFESPNEKGTKITLKIPIRKELRANPMHMV